MLSAVYAIVAAALIFVVWAIAAEVIDSEYTLPRIGATFEELGRIFTLDTFWRAFGQSLIRTTIGYIIAVVLAGLLYFFSCVSKSFMRVIAPLISFLRTLPTMAVTLILGVWAGGYATPIILGVLVIMPMLYSAFKQTRAGVQQELLEIAALCGAGKTTQFTAVWFPRLAAELPESLSSAFSLNIKVVVAAEILMHTAASIGMLMYMAQINLQIAALIALTFAAVVAAVVGEAVIRRFLHRLLARYSA